MKSELCIIFLLSALWCAVESYAWTGDVAGRPLDVHGFVSQGYLKSDHGNYLGPSEEGTFNFTEYALNASLYPADNVYVGAQIFARRLGYWGSYKPDLDWAVVDYRFKDWLGARVGRVRIPHGLYNETRDTDALRTSVFLSQSVYNEAWRDAFMSLSFGGGLYGVTPPGSFGHLDYRLYYGTLGLKDNSGFVTYLGDQFGAEASNVKNDDVWSFSLQWITPADGLRFGYTDNSFDLSGDLHTWATSPSWTHVFGPGGGAHLDYRARPRAKVFSVEYTWNDLTFAAEYMRANQNYRLNVPDVGPLSENDPIMEAYYASAHYRFTDWMEVGVSYSEFYPDRKDRDGRRQSTGRPDTYSWLKDFALTARFDVGDVRLFKLEGDLILKLEGHLMNGAASLPARKNLDEGQEDITERNWLLFMSKVT